MSHRHQWLAEVAAELRDRGHSQNYINRLVAELSHHYEDLQTEKSMSTRSHDELVSKMGNAKMISQAAESSVKPSRAWLNAFVLPIVLALGMWFATGLVLMLFVDGVYIDVALNPISRLLISSIVAIAPFMIPAVASIFILRKLRRDMRRFRWSIAGLAVITVLPFIIFPNVDFEAQRSSVCLALTPLIRPLAIVHALAPIAVMLYAVTTQRQSPYPQYA